MGIEDLPEEQREIEEALARAATPTHPEFGESLAQPLQAFGEFYPLSVLRGLQAEIETMQAENYPQGLSDGMGI
jgi:hypothetical protein